MSQYSIANYQTEQRLFQTLITSNEKPNILMFQGESGSGKSKLIEHCLSTVKDVPAARIRLESGGESIPNLFNVMGSKIGRQQLPIFSETVADLIGEPVEEKDALWQVKLRRHLREVGRISDIETRQERYQLLTDAWFADVQSFTRPMLLAVDTYEKHSTEFDQWFRDEFLYGVAQSNRLRVLIGGQTLPEKTADWELCTSIHQLKGVSDAQEWLVWGEQHGIEIPSLEVMVGIILALRGNPSAIVETLESQFHQFDNQQDANNPAETLYQRRKKLRETIIQGFNLSELKDICSDMDIDYETLPDHTEKRGFVRELIAYVSRIGRLPELIAICQEERPNLVW